MSGVYSELMRLAQQREGSVGWQLRFDSAIDGERPVALALGMTCPLRDYECRCLDTPYGWYHITLLKRWGYFFPRFVLAAWWYP